MATTQDKKVQQLFEIVQKKKAEIAKAEKPSWQTNCSFGYMKDSSQRWNIQTLTNKEDLIEILAFLIDRASAYQLACETLKTESEFKWMGYSLDEWKSDIQTRLNKIEISKKKQELETFEKRLDTLVSPEMRAELELAAIEKELLK